MTWTPTTLSLLDGPGTPRPVIAYTDGTNYSFPHSLLDETGAIIAPATRPTMKPVAATLTRPNNTTAYAALNATGQGKLMYPTGGPAYLDLAAACGTARSGTIYAQMPTGPVPYRIASGTSLFAMIECRAISGYTPIAVEALTLTLTLATD